MCKGYAHKKRGRDKKRYKIDGKSCWDVKKYIPAVWRPRRRWDMYQKKSRIYSQQNADRRKFSKIFKI
jgi:hypothetical protein